VKQLVVSLLELSKFMHIQYFYHPLRADRLQVFIQLDHLRLAELPAIHEAPAVAGFDCIAVGRYMMHGKDFDKKFPFQGLSFEVQHSPAVPLPNQAFPELNPALAGLHPI
jgi:hypothetical protein